MRSIAAIVRRLLLTAPLFISLVPPAYCQINLGAFGGVDRTGLSGDAPAETKYRAETGFTAGVVAELMIAEDVWLSVQPNWQQRGTRIAFAVEGKEEEVDSLKVGANYLTLPLLLKIVAGHGKTYVSGGIDIGFLLNATLTGAGGEQDVKSTFEPVDLSAIFAFGVMLPIGKPRLTVELRYAQGILNTASSEQDPEVYSLPPRFRWAGFRLLVGIMYPMGGGGS
jgi:hypothetical protein